MNNDLVKKEGFKMRRIDFLIVFVFFAIPFWVYMVTPKLLSLPGNYHYSANVQSVDNPYNEATGEYRGEQYSKTTLSYDVSSHQGNQLLVKGIFDVKALDGKTIFHTEPSYGVDALTGKHIPTLGNRPRQGYLFAPRGLQSNDTFTYWHISSETPGLMKYTGDEYLYGLHVLRFETDSRLYH